MIRASPVMAGAPASGSRYLVGALELAGNSVAAMSLAADTGL